MNYQTIKLKGGAEVYLDLDAKRTKCKKCGELIRFGMTKNNKYIPVIQIGDEWQCHFADCKFANEFRKKNVGLNERIQEEETNQDFLNSI